MKSFKCISTLLVMSLMLGGCADSSDSMEAQKEAMTAAQTQALQKSGNEATMEAVPLSQAEILAAVPARVTMEVTGEDETQKIDAEVILPDHAIMTGTLEKRDFSEDEIKEYLKDSKFVDDMERLDILIDPDVIVIRDTAYNKNPDMETENKDADLNAYQQLANELMQQLGSEQKAVEGTSYLGSDGEVYDFRTTAMIHDTLVEANSQPKAYSSGGTLIDGKLSELSIYADYLVKDEEEASLMEFSDILKAFETLMENGAIVPTPSGQPVETIRLCYMADARGNKYTFYPVWNFEVSYTAEWLKGDDGPHATRYVVLDACTGELVEHHIGGVE